jgi:amino acid permease
VSTDERHAAAAPLIWFRALLRLFTPLLQAVAARDEHWADIKLFHFDIQALYAISIVVFGFNCHANVVSVFYELEHYPDRIISRLPAR